MKDRVDKSMGIVTLIPEGVTKVKPTDPLRFVKCVVRQKLKMSDSSSNSPDKILPSSKKNLESGNRRTKSS